MRRKLEAVLFLSLGALLGLGIAAFRSGMIGPVAQAQSPSKQADKQSGGIFSPPGTSDTGPVAPPPGEPTFKGRIGRTIGESTSDWPLQATAPKDAPNVLLIVLDDVGYAALGCYGSPVVKTPHLDKLAKNGLRYNNFHTTALCSPSRSCFLTGRNHHSNAMACITEGSTGYPGSYGRVPLANGLLSEMLTPFGWAAFAIGKWHLTPAEDMNLGANRKWWPLGRGFDRFYGFLGGEVDQWTPWLAYDNHFIKPPKTPEQGYHNVPDLVDKAKEFIADLKQVAPDRPFFMYFCPGACHAPHHAPKEWIAKYKGKFDAGWDDYREKALANQIALGICPAGTRLSPRDRDVPEWDKLGREEKELYARQMEVYAAYLSYVDHHIGELIAFLTEMGQLDNTLIITVSDNGASAEGGPHGSFNENLFFNNVPDSLKQNLKHLKRWGDPSTYPHYSWGWAWATNSPFRRWKREVTRGGTADLCIVHWPRGIKEKNAIRRQFTHATDLVPTVLDALHSKMPKSINGVVQNPLQGVSFAPTFASGKAKIPREAQYFEMFAQRALYVDGWRAYAPWEFGKQITAKDLANDKWMLFHIDEDFSESTDVAAKYPAKLEELKQLWWIQASKYKVLPLDGSGVERLATPRPQMSAPRNRYVYYPGTGEIESSNAVDIRSRSCTITADVEVPEDGAEGVLLAHGSSFGGYTFFVNKERKLQFSHNYVGLNEYKIISTEKIPAGKVTMRWQFSVTGPPNLAIGKGAPGTGKLFINGVQVGEGKIPVTCAIAYGLSGDGLCCGRDSLTPVSADYRGEYPFTGVIRRVVVETGNEGAPAPQPPMRD
ncbi:MAG: arylsulfatase [Planctomycetes bacterium]|nr:arylsulfatase [Planctomycetota bacterium]